MNGKSPWHKYLVRILALTLAALLALAAVVAAVIPALADAPRDQYELHIDIWEDTEAARVEQTVRYTNQTGTALDAVLFNIQINAYRRWLTAPAAQSEGFTPGGAVFSRVTVNGEPADWGVQGENEAVLRVACPLEPGESAEFGFSYEILLPGCEGALGVGEMGWRLCGFYPQAAVFDAALGDFQTASPTEAGDWWYAEAADYRVRVTLPDSWMLGAGAEVARSRTDESGRVTCEFSLQDARALALALGRRYTRYEGQSQRGTRVAVLSNQRVGAGRALSAALAALDVYEGWFGALPRGQLVLAQADMGGGWLARDGLILLDSDDFALGAGDDLEYAVALGAARQWFGGAVGNDALGEPWLGESLSAYAGLLYYEQRYGEARFQKELNARVLPALQLTLPGGVRVDSEAGFFNSASEYDTVLRGRGAAVLHELRAALGRDVLLSGWSEYLRQNAGCVANSAAFADALSTAAGRDISEFLLDLLANIGDYAGQNMDSYS